MRRTLFALSLAVALMAMGSGPGLAAPQVTTLGATLVGDGDPDGSGSALLELDTKTTFGTICPLRIEVENVSRPITGALITAGDSGEVVGRIFIQDSGGVIENGPCTAQAGIKTRDLKRIEKNPAGHFLHLYNAEHPCDIFSAAPCAPGALIGPLETVS